jgi:transposase-like protein
VLKFGTGFRATLGGGRPTPRDTRHLVEMVVAIVGRRMRIKRVVDSECGVLEVLAPPRRDEAAASKLLKKLQGFPQSRYRSRLIEPYPTGPNDAGQPNTEPS